MTKQSKKLRIKRIRLRNVMGIEELEVSADGQLVRIEGDNATGKSSIVQAVESIIKGGHDVRLLRNGADEAEVYLLLEDDTEVTKSIKPTGSNLSVRHPDYGSISGPKGWIEQHFDIMSVNPVELVLAEKSEIILQALPMEVSMEQLSDAIGGLVHLTDDVDADGLGDAAEYVDTSQHALKAIAQLHDRLYMRRRDVNRDAKQKDGAIANLRRSLPENLDDVKTADEVIAERDDLKQQLEAVKAEANAAGEKLAENARAQTFAIDEEINGRIAANNKERDELLEQIAQLRAKVQKLESATETLESERASRKSKVKSDFNEEKAEALKEYQPRISELQAAIKSLDSAIGLAAERSNTLKMLREHESEKKALDAESDKYTDALESLDALKASLLSELPIEGLTIGDDGEIYVDDVPFVKVNDAKKVEIAIQILQLRGGKAAFVDRIEQLGQATYERLIERAREAGLQLFTMEVAEGKPLTAITGEDAYTTPRPREAAAKSAEAEVTA